MNRTISGAGAVGARAVAAWKKGGSRTLLRTALLHGVRTALIHEIKAEGIIEVLAPPVEDNQDDEERILARQINEYTVDSDFTPQNGLERLNVFPT